MRGVRGKAAAVAAMLAFCAGCSASITGHASDGGNPVPDGKADAPTDGSTSMNGDGGMQMPMPPRPSCTDGARNQDETAVDCGGVCPSCSPDTYSLRLSDFMKSDFDITVDGVRYTDENSLSPVYREVYNYCLWDAPDAASCRATTLAGCPNLQPNQWGCLEKLSAETTGAGWKFGFYEPKPNFAFLSKSGYPASTLEIFWFDSAWVYTFSSTTANGAKNFQSYTQPLHPNVTFPNRGGMWYRNAFTATRGNPSWRYDGPVVLAPDNDVITFKNNAWSSRTVWGPGTPGSEGYVVARYRPRAHGFGNEGGGMLPNVLNVIELESGRRDVAHPEIVRFQETYFYAGYGENHFGLVRFELWSSEPTVCTDAAGRYPDAPCNGHMVRYGMVAPNRFTLTKDYAEAAYPTTKAFFDAAMAARPLNDPKPRKRAVVEPNLPPMRGGFQYPGPGSDAYGAATVGDWVLLESDVADADWFFRPGTDWKCPEAYTYLGSVAVDGTVDDAGRVVTGRQWIQLCGTDDDLRLEKACPAGYTTRGWFQARLGARTSSGVDVPASDTYINWCVRSSQCAGACYPSTLP